MIISHLKTLTMKTTDQNKLQKALKLMKQAQLLLNEVSESDKNFKFSSNSNFRINRVCAAVSIVESEVKEFTK